MAREYGERKKKDGAFQAWEVRALPDRGELRGALGLCVDCCRGMWRSVLLTSLGSIPSTERSSLTAADEESGYWSGAKEG